jgi:ribulose 1,5-bisphosphate synthetase/thiazole synthase
LGAVEANTDKVRWEQPTKKHRRTIENYDIITIGSGHNALVAAALLASTGQRVLMLE